VAPSVVVPAGHGTAVELGQKKSAGHAEHRGSWYPAMQRNGHAVVVATPEK